MGKDSDKQSSPGSARYWRDMYTDLLKRVDAGEFVSAAPSSAGSEHACLTCYGDGRLSGEIVGFQDSGDMQCPDCRGTGRGPAHDPAMDGMVGIVETACAAQTALRNIAAIGGKITDPKNTYGLQMTNIALAALEPVSGQQSCPCGAGETECPGPDGKPIQSLDAAATPPQGDWYDGYREGFRDAKKINETFGVAQPSKELK